MKITIHQFVRVKGEHKDFAGDSVAAFGVDIGNVSAATVARDLDKNGSASKFAHLFGELKQGRSLAVGHGVVVVYPSGRTQRFYSAPWKR